MPSVIVDTFTKKVVDDRWRGVFSFNIVKSWRTMTTIKFRNINPHTMPEPSLEHPDYYPIQRRPYVDEDGNIWRPPTRAVCNNNLALEQLLEETDDTQKQAREG